jgi:DNA-binding GntR family transcriptional regulator
MELNMPGLHVPTYKRAAYEALRDMIIELELPPGSRLVESDLARRLRVSKTPVREAIGLLEIDGLIEFAPYRGATVRWLTVPEMDEQTYLIDTMEIPALPRVVQGITNAELADVRRVVDSMREARAQNNGRRFRQLTAEYHRLLFAPAGYPRLVRFLELVVPTGLRYDRIFCDNFADIWDVQVALIVARFEAIERREPEEAAASVRANRLKIKQLTLSRLSHPDVVPYFETTTELTTDSIARRVMGAGASRISV